jgi:hypothetical protein
MTGDIAVSGVIDTVEQLRTIPAGTVIGDPEGTECYRRGPRGGWHRYDRASGAESAFRGDPPTGLVVLQGAPGTLLEPLDQFKLRFRDHAWAKSEQFTTNLGITERALRSLGCNELPWLTGAPVISNWSKENLPTGVTVSVGNPKQYDTYGVWAKKNGGLQHLLGGNTFLQSGVVLTVDGEVRLPVPVKPDSPGGMVSVRPPVGWDQRIWDQLPVGTRLNNIPGAANGQWVICGNHRADEYRYAANDVAGYTGRYRLADFNRDRLTIASFPTGENT